MVAWAQYRGCQTPSALPSSSATKNPKHKSSFVGCQMGFSKMIPHWRSSAPSSNKIQLLRASFSVQGSNFFHVPSKRCLVICSCYIANTDSLCLSCVSSRQRATREICHAAILAMCILNIASTLGAALFYLASSFNYYVSPTCYTYLMVITCNKYLHI